MPPKAGHNIVRQLQFAVAAWKDDSRSDAALLYQFNKTGDEQAFASLVGRHSRLIWGVCLRVLRNREDAEDALQATFLRLARDAKRIAKPENLPGWLFRVAYFCAIDLRRSIVRQKRIEERLTEIAERSTQAPEADLHLLLDDELSQLSRTERSVLVQVYLEGRTYAEAAMNLRCSIAEVHRRLVRAQTRLRRRLASQHGNTLATTGLTLLAAGVARDVSAAPPAVLARAVVAALDATSTGVLPATRAGALAVGLTLGTATTIARGMLLASGLAISLAISGLFAAYLPSAQQYESPVAEIEPPRPDTLQPDAPMDSAVSVSGVVRNSAGQPIPGAMVVAFARRPFGPGERGLHDEVLTSGIADTEGRFSLKVQTDFATWFADRVVTLQTSAQGFAPITQSVHLTANEQQTELRLPVASPLSGRLVDPDGRCVSGVRLEVVRIGDVVSEPVVGGNSPARPLEWPQPVQTDAAGAFAFPAIGGTSNVWVRVNDSRYAFSTVRVDRPADREIVVHPARTVMVEVLGDDTGAPLANARVTAITEDVASHPHFCVTKHGMIGPRALPSDIDAVTDSAGIVRLRLRCDAACELLVHPPNGADPYVGVRRVIDPGTESRFPLTIQLRRGRWVTGRVCDLTTGRPVPSAAVHWARVDATKPEWRDDVLVGRDAVVRADTNGKFQLAVLPGRCSIRVYGPTLDFTHAVANIPGKKDRTLFAHAITTINIPASGVVPEVNTMLRSGVEVCGQIEHPAGVRDSGNTFLLCSGRVSPIRAYSALPLPTRDGTFTLPGCGAVETNRVYILDPTHRVGGVATVMANSPEAPVVKLAECGRVRVRALREDGQPLPAANVMIKLLLDRACPVSESDNADEQPVEWFDAINYRTRPLTDAHGEALLPALIPGARYSISVRFGTISTPTSQVTIEPGVTITLPDFILMNPMLTQEDKR